jgi:hypothetical protein
MIENKAFSLLFGGCDKMEFMAFSKYGENYE